MEKWQRRLSKWLGSSRTLSWLFAHTLPHVDRLLLRLSGGRLSPVRLLGDLPLALVTTTGAKSGRRRTVPLVSIPDGENLILIASNWGRARHPAWYHNMRANPRVEATVNGRTRAYRAEEISGAAYERYWQRAVAIYPGYEAYKERAAGRRIPVLRLRPLDGSD